MMKFLTTCPLPPSSPLSPPYTLWCDFSKKKEISKIKI